MSDLAWIYLEIALRIRQEATAPAIFFLLYKRAINRKEMTFEK